MYVRRQMAGSFHSNARFTAMMATFDLQWHRFIPGITVDEWTEVEMELDRDPSLHNVDFNDVLHQAANAGRESESEVTSMDILDQDADVLDLDVGLNAARANCERGNDDTWTQELFDEEMHEGDFIPTQPYGEQEAAQASDPEYIPDTIESEADSESAKPTADHDEVKSAKPVSRFSGPNDVESFITEQKNKSTTRKTKQHLDIFLEFLETKNEDRAPHTIPPADLDEYLASFFVSIKKISEDGQDVQDYEPCTIKGMQSSIARYLKEKKYAASIIQSDVFFKSREAIAAKCKSLKKMGRGNRPNRKRAPTTKEIQDMWSSGALGDSSPSSLQNTMWWILSTRFGLRANKENYDLRWGDVELKEGDKPYLTRRERSTKTRQGDNITDIRDEVQVYQDDDQPQYCPIRLYKKYASKRPSEMCKPEAKFYIQPKVFSSKTSLEKEPVWYKNQVCIHLYSR